MANDYNELEQLVNDVTSLDTARMTLRWALERLNSIEKEKADLKKNLTLAEETAKRLQLKEASLTDAYSSRSKTLEEKEDFYTKLEATMSLLGEGKLDIQQLLKKEAKLDSLRHSLESEYSDKFEELDRNQRAVIERWNGRLLEVESQYAGRLAEAQKKYDGLRSELEGDYQGRLTALQNSFKSREKELSERINGLESSVRHSEEKVETRRRELEGEYLAKKRETEENYRKLRSMLEAGLEEKLRAADSDHAEQVRAFEASWQIERARLLEEQHVREAQFASAQDRIKEIENALAVQQEAHHSELLKIISEKETAFRAQLSALETEKSAKEAAVRELQARLEKKAAAWDADRARLQAEFDARIGSLEAAQTEHAASLEKNYEGKKQELENIIAASRAEFVKEFEARLQAERQSMDVEKSILEGEKRAREEALAVSAARLAEVERALTATREEHHKDLMERLRSGEASFREKLAGFEAEKQAYNETVNNLRDELRSREGHLLEEKNKIAAEFEAKSAIHAEMLARTEASFEEKRRAYEEKIAGLAAKLTEADKASAIERENFKNELSRITSEVEEMAEGRAAATRADYENRKADLEKEFAARYSDKLKALEAEKARVNEALAENESRLAAAKAAAAAAETECGVQRTRFEAEAAARIAAAFAEAAAKTELEKGNWQAERARLEQALLETSENFKSSQKEIGAMNAKLREVEMENAGREDRFALELMEAKANYEKELSFRVKESVAMQTADLVKSLDAAMAGQTELTAALEASGRTVDALNKAATEAKRDYEMKVLTAISEGISARREELEKAYAARSAALEEDCKGRREALAGEFSLRNARLADENASLKAELEKTGAEAAAAGARVKELSEKLLTAEMTFHSEKLELQKAQIEEMDERLSGAVAAAVETLELKLRHAQEELARQKKSGMEEAGLLEEGFAEEKDRLLEELALRDRYIEGADARIQELEHEMLKSRETSTGELMKNISEQDRHFRELAAEEKARSDARVKQLETLLSAKEKLMAEGDSFYRQKQLELDGLHAALNMRVNKFNEELFAQKQALSEKEKELNEAKLKLEKDYSLKTAELEQMKTELTRAIADYKGRK